MCPSFSQGFRSRFEKSGSNFSHSHRGFSPVRQTAEPHREPFQRFFSGVLRNQRRLSLIALMIQRKVFSQAIASAAKETVETVLGCL